MPALSNPNRSRSGVVSGGLALLCAALISLGYASLPSLAQGQEHANEMDGELVANLAAGRVVIAVAKDGMVIAALENKIEPGTRVPQVVPLSGRRAAILLGAVDWTTPSSGPELVRLSDELPQLRHESLSEGPHLQPGGPEVGSEVESLGLGLLDRLRAIAEHLHGKLDVGTEEPIVEVVMAGDDPDAGPEVWLLQYTINQEPLRGDYWQTKVKRPSYHQLWPPEKGQPRTLVEVRYPPEDNGPSLDEMLRRGDGRLEKVRSGDPALAVVETALVKGENQKASLADTTQFLCGAFNAISPPNAGEAVAVISEQGGFDWILKPPQEKKRILGRPARLACSILRSEALKCCDLEFILGRCGCFNEEARGQLTLRLWRALAGGVRFSQ